MNSITCKITVTGLVQGIGFRPFVAELAEELGLVGQVKNLGGIVEIIASGDKKAVDEIIQRLKSVAETGELPGCRVDEIEVEMLVLDQLVLSINHLDKFEIVESGNTREVRRFLPADLPTCDRCVKEMHSPRNRRYRYPFISCTACGPRFSIQKKVPYDRETITMDDFQMCDACREEYTQKGNIRRHAQTIACRECGPELRYVEIQDTFIKDNKVTHEFLQISDEMQAVSEAAYALLHGKIGAIKDIGGYHFAFLPTDSYAASRLREFKNRDKKPFAVMFLNVDEVKKYCEVSEKEAAILESSARPIVLLKKKKDFAPEVCGESDRIGALLPCNPLQILLLEETGPLVMTSGNRGGEPIIISEEEMMQHLGNGIDFMLTHNREILTPLDDSICQVADTGEVQLIRRARGMVPDPIILNRKLKKDTFAAGGDLKAVFALGREELVYLSQYFGDLEDVRCMQSRELGRKRMEELLEIHPETTIGDLHLAYVSTQGMEVKVQHHHAHVASVIAEHGLEGKVLGIACDGTGLGTDGTIWGSEFLLCEEDKMSRLGQFSSVRLLGGDSSAKQADMTLYSYMLEAKDRGYEDADFFKEEKIDASARQQLNFLEMAWKQNINTAYSSSMGRLFDAVAALLGVCHYNSYEGECAIKLEQAAHIGKREIEHLKEINSSINIEDILSISLKKDAGIWQADSLRLLIDLARLRDEYPKEILTYVFHHAVANAIVEIAEKVCKENDVNQLALCGGSFINRILLAEVASGLRKQNKDVYINEKVPCGDGGIALGQIYLSTF